MWKFETNFQKESNFTDGGDGADCNQISRTLKSSPSTVVSQEDTGLLLSIWFRVRESTSQQWITDSSTVAIYSSHTRHLNFNSKACPPSGGDVNALGNSNEAGQR